MHEKRDMTWRGRERMANVTEHGMGVECVRNDEKEREVINESSLRAEQDTTTGRNHNLSPGWF